MRTVDARLGFIVYTDEAGVIKVDDVRELLEEIPDGVYRAIGSAVKRAARHGLTVGMKLVSQEYDITQRSVKRYTENINHLNRNTEQWVFGYRGNVIPLIQFNTRYGRGDKIYTRVKRESTSEALDHAFVAQMNSHTGVYERTGTSRFPIEQKYGPSVPQAFQANQDLLDMMEEEIINTYEARIDHEILRVLNGWGVSNDQSTAAERTDGGH